MGWFREDSRALRNGKGLKIGHGAKRGFGYIFFGPQCIFYKLELSQHSHRQGFPNEMNPEFQLRRQPPLVKLFSKPGAWSLVGTFDEGPWQQSAG